MSKDDQIKFLWKLLDDISTAGDMFKPEITPYFDYVNKKCEDRSKVANSEDGYTLTITPTLSDLHNVDRESHYYHPVTMMCYRRKHEDCFEFCVLTPCWDPRKKWIKSGMVRGFLLITE